MRSRATARFWRCYDGLPEGVQEKAREAYRLWLANPHHPSLQFKRLHGTDGMVWSVRIGLSWRALATVRGDEVRWFWIGSLAEYDRLVGGDD